MSGILLVDNARHLLKEAVKVINTINSPRSLPIKMLKLVDSWRATISNKLQVFLNLTLYAHVQTGGEKVRLVFDKFEDMIPRDYTINRNLNDIAKALFRSHVFLRELEKQVNMIMPAAYAMKQFAEAYT
jgi:hypothetical protein